MVLEKEVPIADHIWLDLHKLGLPQIEDLFLHIHQYKEQVSNQNCLLGAEMCTFSKVPNDAQLQIERILYSLWANIMTADFEDHLKYMIQNERSSGRFISGQSVLVVLFRASEIQFQSV